MLPQISSRRRFIFRLPPLDKLRDTGARSRAGATGRDVPKGLRQPNRGSIGASIRSARGCLRQVWPSRFSPPACGEFPGKIHCLSDCAFDALAPTIPAFAAADYSGAISFPGSIIPQTDPSRSTLGLSATW